MRIIAVDDERLSLEALVKAIGEAIPEGEIHPFRRSAEAEAYAKENPCEMAFLDIEMPEISGLQLAVRLRQLCPAIQVVFVTGYDRYAIDAINQTNALGYLLKPVTAGAIRDLHRNKALLVNRNPSRLSIRCFGNFEVFANGTPVHFVSSKGKELLALLVDRNGASVNTREIAAVLFPDSPYDISTARHIGKIWSRLRESLREVGQEDVLVGHFNAKSIDTSRVDCDYYSLLRGENAGRTAYSGEYMSQYEWAELTNGGLSQKYL